MARIVGVDLKKNKRGEIGLTYIYGIGRSTARAILDKAQISYDLKVKDWSDENVAAIRNVIASEGYKVEGELRSTVQLNIKRLMDIGCYRGIRHRLGLPVRGQSTKNNARTRKGRKKTVANKKNLHELESLYQLMKELKVVSWRVINVDPIGRAKENKEILLDKEEYQYLFSFIKEKREENIINVEYGCSHYLGLSLEKELRDTYFSCVAGLYVASILSNGDIFICPNVERRKEFIQGNIKHDNFVEVWENKFQLFRTDNRTKSDQCNGCPNWKYCLGDSFHTFDFEKKKPCFCIRELYEEI